MAKLHDMEALAELPIDDLVERVKARGGLPGHIAIIMDGNGRWAQKRYLPRVAGHRAGRHAVRRCLEICGRLGIDVLTLYTFSQENFNRPAAEVKSLWHFLQESLAAEREELDSKKVRLTASGALDQLPEPARLALEETIDALAHNTGLTLNLALAYGGRQEILHAAMRLHERLQSGELQAGQVTEGEFAKGLYSPELPDPDLVIRTSGEARLSNFLPWQTAYSEILITSVLWPDFSQRDLILAIADYQNRERRFGALPADSRNNGPKSQESLFDPARWKRLLKVRP